MAAEHTTRTIEKWGTLAVSGSTVIIAFAGYVVLMVASRYLSVEENTYFLTFWSLQFFCFGILTGLQNEMIRSVRNVHSPTHDESVSGARVLPVALFLGAIVAFLVLVLSPVAGTILGQGYEWGVLIIALGAFLYAGQCGVNGTFGGLGQWTKFSTIGTVESLARLILVWVFVAVSAGGIFGVYGAELGTALGAGMWVLCLILIPGFASVRHIRADRSSRELIVSAGRSMLGGVGNATILVGFPVLMSLTTSPEEYATAAPFILALSMTRAPIMMPLTSFQGVVISHFVGNPDKRGRLLGKFSALILGIGVIGAALAAWIGPPLMQLFFGANYWVDGWVLAVLTLSASLIAEQTILGAILMSMSKQGAFAVGWLVCAVVSVACLLVPMPLIKRVCVALTVGMLAGIGVSLVLIFRRHQS